MRIDYEEEALSFMGMNDKDEEGNLLDYIELGEFSPSDSPLLVHHLSNKRVLQLRSITDLTPTNQAIRSVLYKMRFKSFEEYKKQTKKDATIKQGDIIGTGEAISFNTTDIKGYMAYLSKAAPDLQSFFFTRLNSRIAEDTRKRHTHILGGSGSGKTELLKLLLYSYIRKKDYCTTVIFEPHGDLCEEVSLFKEFAEKEGEESNLVYLNADLDAGFTPCINPFEVKDKSSQDIDRMCQVLKEAFAMIISDDGANAFSTQMAAILVPCLAVLLETDDTDIRDLQRFMDDNQNEDLVDIGKRSRNPEHRNFFLNKFDAKSYNQTKLSLYTKLQTLFGSPNFMAFITGKSTVDIEALLDSKKTIVISLSKGVLGDDTGRALGRFIVAMIQGYIKKRQKIPKNQRIPVHCFIDEFQNYISPKVREILEELRKYGLHLTLANQFMDQVSDSSLKKSLRANTKVKIFGIVEDDDLKTAADTMKVDKEAIEKLDTGQFYVKSGKNPSFKLYAPTFLLGKRHRMTWEEWDYTKKKQLERYYKPRYAQRTTETQSEGINPDEYMKDAPNQAKVIQQGEQKARSKKSKAIIPKFQINDE